MKRKNVDPFLKFHRPITPKDLEAVMTEEAKHLGWTVGFEECSNRGYKIFVSSKLAGTILVGCIIDREEMLEEVYLRRCYLSFRSLFVSNRKISKYRTAVQLNLTKSMIAEAADNQAEKAYNPA